MATNNDTGRKPWTLHQLQEAIRRDLDACRTEFERTNAAAIGRAEMRKLANEIRTARKLTPGEEAILSAHGIR